MRLYNPTETRSRITGTPALKVNRLQNNMWKRDKEYWEKAFSNEADNMLNQMRLLEDKVFADRHNMSGGFLWNQEEEEVIKGEGDE